MTLTRRNLSAIGHIALFGVIYFIADSFISAILSGIMWEFGFALMGLGVFLMAFMKDTRFDNWWIFIFDWGMGFLLADLSTFITVLAGSI